MNDKQNAFECLITDIYNTSKNFHSRKHVIDTVVSAAFVILKHATTTMARPHEAMGHRLERLTLKVQTEDYEKIKESALCLISMYQVAEPFSDILSGLYGSLLSYEKGQHMTPQDIADVLFELHDVLSQYEDLPSKEQPLSIGDMTGCGLGSLLLGQLRGIYLKHGRAGIRNIDLFGIDIDTSMCMATIFQIEVASVMFNIPYNQMTIWNDNAITGYDDRTENIVYVCAPNKLTHKMGGRFA